MEHKKQPPAIIDVTRIPPLVRLMLAIDLSLIGCEGVIPSSRDFLPVGGSELAQVGMSLVLSIAVMEVYHLVKQALEVPFLGLSNLIRTMAIILRRRRRRKNGRAKKPPEHTPRVRNQNADDALR
jgi:hypothetical protein